jgi:hypothetical protein
VKIGSARRLRKRLENLQAGSIQRLILLAYCDGDRAVENAVHERLLPWQIREDWFEMCDDVRAEFGLNSVSRAFGREAVSARGGTG